MMIFTSAYKKLRFAKLMTLALLTLFVCAAGEPCRAQVERAGERAQEIWFLDSYGMSWNNANEENFEKLKYYKLEGRSWVLSDAQTFFETQDPEEPLIVFVPGYTSTTKDTVEVGMTMVRHFDPKKPARVVLWNWPALKRYCSLGHDIRAKMPVASASSDYLVMLLRKVKPESKVCIYGFSFGNRIVLDTVERLGTERPEGMRIRLVLGSAATDRSFLAYRHRNGNVPALSEKILVFYNPVDRALIFYPLIYGDGSRPQALGLNGASLCSIRPEYRNRFEMVNLFPEVGVRHITVVLMRSPAFRQRIGTYFFFDGETHTGASTIEEIPMEQFTGPVSLVSASVQSEEPSESASASETDAENSAVKTLYRYRHDGRFERISVSQ